MSFAMAGNLLSLRWFIVLYFWELALIPIYFIALIWGNGDAEERKKAVIKFFIYTLAGSLFMLIAFVLYKKSRFFLDSRFIRFDLTRTEQF
jgi:NADH-quinone oxidoreductase subunit M